MTNLIQVHVTAGSEAEAQRIAEQLLNEKLAACVQTSGPIHSRYRWQGKLEVGAEWACVAKSTADLYPLIETTIRAAHSYDEPEIIATRIEFSSAGYIAWVEANVRPTSSDR